MEIPKEEVERINNDAENCQPFASDPVESARLGYIAGAKSEYLRREREAKRHAELLKLWKKWEDTPDQESGNDAWCDFIDEIRRQVAEP